MRSPETYAKKIFEVSKEKNKLEVIGHELEIFVAVVEAQEDWLAVMNLTTVSLDKKKQMIDDLYTFDMDLRVFIFSLIENKDLRKLSSIYEEFADLSYQFQKIARVRVYSAEKITKEQEFELIKELTQTLDGQEVIIENIIDENIVGGFKIVFQGQSLDQTLKNELDELKTIL